MRRTIILDPTIPSALSPFVSVRPEPFGRLRTGRLKGIWIAVSYRRVPLRSTRPTKSSRHSSEPFVSLGPELVEGANGPKTNPVKGIVPLGIGFVDEGLCEWKRLTAISETC